MLGLKMKKVALRKQFLQIWTYPHSLQAAGIAARDKVTHACTLAEPYQKCYK